MSDKKKFEQTLYFVSVFLLPFSTRKQISVVVLAVFQGRYPRAITIKPLRQLVAIDRYQSYFRKLDNFVSGKQQGALSMEYFRKAGRMHLILIKKGNISVNLRQFEDETQLNSTQI